MKTTIVPFPMLRNLRIRVVTFTKPDEYIHWRKRSWDDQRDGYPAASCLGWQRDPLHYDVDICMCLTAIPKFTHKASLAHEAIHAVQFIFEKYGFKDVELQSYLAEYILQYCFDRKVV